MSKDWPEPVRKVLNAYRPIFDLDEDHAGDIGVETPIPEFPTKLINELCECYISHLQKLDTLVEIEAPIYILGDIHGNIFDLLRLLVYSRPPPQTRLLFLGDYVDRGEYSIDVVTLLFALAYAYPENVVLLRGNHEFEHVNQSYGFYDEVMSQRGSKTLYQNINKVFSWLPFAAVVSNTIFCVHGGLSPSLTSLKQLRGLPRPMAMYEGDLVSDLVWSDPQQTGELDYVRNQRGCGVVFGNPAISKFCKETKMNVIVRGHECVMLGVQKFGDHVYTVFSSSSYEDIGNNRAGLMFVDAQKQIQVFSLPPLTILPRSRCRFSKPLGNTDPWSGSALALNLKLADIRKDMARSFETIKTPFGRKPGRSNSVDGAKAPTRRRAGTGLPPL